MKSLNTWLVSSVGFCLLVAASRVSAQVSDTFILVKGGIPLETFTLTDAQEKTAGAGFTFSATFPQGTMLVGAVDGDPAKFVLEGNKLVLQVASDGSNDEGANDPGESMTLLIETKSGKPSPVAQALLIGSDMPPPAIPEPGTIGLFCAGLIGLWFRTRAKRG